MRIVCDFDGTITRQDTTDWVLDRLAAPAWRDVEARWLAGRISAAECMRRQTALLGGTSEELDAALDAVELDPGFLDFVRWCEPRGLPISIVSDGIDRFIARILARHGLERLPVVANVLAGAPGAWRLEQPWARSGCAAGSGVCKCEAAGPWPLNGATTVYVGDGRSDFCVAHRADLLFAKGDLAAYIGARGEPYLPFETFEDVTQALSLLLGEAAKAGLSAAL